MTEAIAIPEGPDPLLHYLATLPSPRSRAAVLGALRRAAVELARLDGLDEAARAQVTAQSYRWGTPGALTYARVNLAVAAIAQTHKPLARLALSALRGVARAALNLGLLSPDEHERIGGVRGPRLSGSQRGRALSPDEVAALYGACRADPSPRGRRDAALIATMLGAGLRRFEASALDLADFATTSEGALFRVRHGKGDKADEVHAPPDVARALLDWIDARGKEAGPLFPAATGGRRPLKAGSRITPSGVYKALLARAEEAGIERAAPHDLRRSMITAFLERTGDLALAQRQARHSSPATTARYDKRKDAALRRALAGSTTGYRPQGK